MTLPTDVLAWKRSRLAQLRSVLISTLAEAQTDTTIGGVIRLSGCIGMSVLMIAARATCTEMSQGSALGHNVSNHLNAI